MDFRCIEERKEQLDPVALLEKVHQFLSRFPSASWPADPKPLPLNTVKVNKN